MDGTGVRRVVLTRVQRALVDVVTIACHAHARVHSSKLRQGAALARGRATLFEVNVAVVADPLCSAAVGACINQLRASGSVLARTRGALVNVDGTVLATTVPRVGAPAGFKSSIGRIASATGVDLARVRGTLVKVIGVRRVAVVRLVANKPQEITLSGSGVFVRGW